MVKPLVFKALLHAALALFILNLVFWGLAGVLVLLPACVATRLPAFAFAPATTVLASLLLLAVHDGLEVPW